MLPRRTFAAAACVLALGLVACGNKDEKQGVDSPAREGLSLPLAGIDYDVFITRELNLRIPPDKAYYRGPEAPPGKTLYGVFLKACNNGKHARRTASDFTIVDNQGERFKPISLPRANPFAYEPTVLLPQSCIPEAGSVAQLGPTAASMLLFEFPLEATENRPFNLVVRQLGQQLTFQLDL
jgi:hypothetical protein